MSSTKWIFPKWPTIHPSVRWKGGRRESEERLHNHVTPGFQVQVQVNSTKWGSQRPSSSWTSFLHHPTRSSIPTTQSPYQPTRPLALQLTSPHYDYHWTPHSPPHPLPLHLATPNPQIHIPGDHCPHPTHPTHRSAHQNYHNRWASSSYNLLPSLNSWVGQNPRVTAEVITTPFLGPSTAMNAQPPLPNPQQQQQPPDEDWGARRPV